MNKKIVVIICVFSIISHVVKSQTCLIIENETHSSGIHTYCIDKCIVSPGSSSNPVNISNSAQVDYISEEKIVLNPGFSASNLSGNGYFRARIEKKETFVFIEPGATVGRFNKIEFGIKLPSNVQNLVNNFLNTGTGTNPFNPDELDVAVVFTHAGLGIVRTVNGFFYEEYTRDLVDNDWNADNSNQYLFRVRFAPPVTGQWKAELSITHNGNSIVSPSCNTTRFFDCINSNNPGYLKIDDTERYLEFSNDDPFFAVGMNLISPSGNGCLGNTLPSNNFADYFNDDLQRIVDAGGNYIRVWMWPDGFGIEEDHVGDYSKRLPFAWELDRVVEFAQNNNIYIQLCMDIAHKYQLSNSFGCVMSWNTNPYNSANGGTVNSPNDFFGDAQSIEYYKRRLRYIAARWGYSSNIAAFEFFNEADHIARDPVTYPSQSNDQNAYANNSNLRMDIYSWQATMAAYMKTTLGIPQLLTTSYAGDPVFPDNSFSLASLDFTNMHDYGSNRNINAATRFGRTESYIADYDKPTLFGEMASAHTTDLDECHDVSFHNALWATAFMGGYGTGLYWWWENAIFPNDYEDNLTALADFMDGVDLEDHEFGIGKHGVQRYPKSNDIANNDDSDPIIEAFLLRSSDEERAMGWVHNRTRYWGNLYNSNSCLNGIVGGVSQRTIEDHNGNDLATDDDLHYIAPQHISSGDREFYIRDLKSLTKYTIEWYHTGNGTLLQKYDFTTGLGHISKGYKVDVPNHINNGTRDIAFKLYKKKLGSFKMANDSSDTENLLTERYSATSGTTTGDYVRDEQINNAFDSSKQEQNTTRDNNYLNTQDGTGSNEHAFTVHPNPNNGTFTVHAPVSHTGGRIIVQNLLGKIVYEEVFAGKAQIIRLGHCAKGMYIVKLIDQNKTWQKKIIVQ